MNPIDEIGVALELVAGIEPPLMLVNAGLLSKANVSGVLAAPTLRAASVTRAESDFPPSTPKSGVETVKSTNPFVTSINASVFVFCVPNGAPPIRSSTESFNSAPERPRATRNTVGVAYSAMSIFPSASLLVPCSAGVLGLPGAE